MRAAVLLPAALPLFASCGITAELWRDRSQTFAVTTEHRVPPCTLQAGTQDGLPTLALELEEDVVPESWQGTLFAADAPVPGGPGALTCQGGARAGLVAALLAGKLGPWRVMRAALIVQSGSAARSAPGWLQVLLYGELAREDVARLLTREEVLAEYPRLEPLIDGAGIGEGYGGAVRAFLNKPWLEWAAVPHREGIRNRLLALVDESGTPIPHAERERVGQVFDRDHSGNERELAEIARLTAVGRLLDDADVTAWYVVVPAPALLLVHQAHVDAHPEDERLRWHLLSDWRYRAHGRVPAGFVANGAGGVLADLVLQRIDRVRVGRRPLLQKILLTPFTVVLDAAGAALLDLFRTDEEPEEDQPRGGRR